VIYLSDIFTYNAKYFQALGLPREKWRSFANSLPGMLKLLHDVAWQFAKKLVHKVVWKAQQCMTLLGNLLKNLWMKLFGKLHSA